MSILHEKNISIQDIPEQESRSSPEWLNYFDQANNLSESKTELQKEASRISLMASAIRSFREEIGIIVLPFHNRASKSKMENSFFQK